MRPRNGHYLWTALGLATPFLLCHPAWTLVDVPLVRSLMISIILFIAPGLPLVGTLLGRGSLKRWHLVWVVGASFLVFGTGVFLISLSGRSLTAGLLWNYTWVVTTLALVTNWLAGGSPTWGVPLESRKKWLAASVFGVAYLMFFWGATRVVPPQDDHDLDLQGTAYALLTRLTPSYETDRGRNYLAHPPLLHAYVAGSFLYFGRLGELAVFDPASPSRLAADKASLHYSQRPFLVETRTPNIFLGALTVALLAAWISTMAGTGVALLIAFAYATLPELFVRFSYGGYFAISSFFALQIVMAVENQARRPDRDARRTSVMVGGLAAWANHKLVLVPLSLSIWSALTAWKDHRLRETIRRVFHPVVIGFLLGTLAFAAYGLWVSPTDYWNDHIRHHIVDRVLNENRRGMDLSVYPSIAGLWFEFWRDTSYLLLPAGVISLLYLLFPRRSPAPPIDPTGAARAGWRGLPGFLATWAILASVAFSLIDWRQTKHLAEIFVLSIVIASALAMGSGRLVRHLLIALVLAILCLNVLGLHHLARDFDSLVKRPEW